MLTFLHKDFFYIHGASEPVAEVMVEPEVEEVMTGTDTGDLPPVLLGVVGCAMIEA
jgi:hypothetical protein